MNRFRLLFAIAVSLVFANAIPSSAGVLTSSDSDFIETAETMIDASVANITFLGRAFGIDPTPLTFSTNLDSSSKSFSFHTVPGSVYAGEPLTLSVHGDFDSIASMWNIKSVGQLGANSVPISGRGSGDWTPGPPPRLGVFTWEFDFFGTIIDYRSSTTARIRHFFPLFIDSYSRAQFTIDGDVVATAINRDRLRYRTWEWRSHSAILAAQAMGEMDPETGEGIFTARVVPEPSSLAIFGLCFVLLAIAVLRRSWEQHSVRDSQIDCARRLTSVTMNRPAENSHR